MDRPDTLALLAFPYTTLRNIGRTPEVLRQEGKEPGAAAVWSMSAIDAAPRITSLVQRPGGLSLLVILPPSPEEGRCQLAPTALSTVLQRLRPHGILPHHPHPAPEELCQILRRPPIDLAGDLTDYLRWRGLRLDSDITRTIHRIFDLSAELRSISAVSRSMYTSRRALGRRFATHGLPVPSHWLQAGRLIRVAVRLQNSDATVGSIAREHGYPDGFSLSNQMERLTGHRPSYVRERLGWEWLVESWLRREADGGRFTASIVAQTRRSKDSNTKRSKAASVLSSDASRPGTPS